MAVAELSPSLAELLGELVSIDPRPWVLDANCREDAGDVDFFPSRGEPTDRARAMCAGCLVRQECLDYALDNSIKYGIWGGLSERERRRIRRTRHQARDRSAAPTP